MKTLPHALVSICLAGFSVFASAAPVHYQESVSGDLVSAGELKNFMLDVGTNTVSGHQSGAIVVVGPMGFFSDDRDSFAFTLAPGLVLESLVITTSNAQGGTAFTAVWRLYEGALAYSGTLIEQLSVSPVPGTDDLSAAPLQAGTYNISSLGTSLVGQYDFDYQFTFNVAAAPRVLPEPTSVALAAIAFAGTIAARRRKKA